MPPDRLFLRVYIDCVKIRIRIKKLLYREARNRRSSTGYHFAIARYPAREKGRVISTRITHAMVAMLQL